MYEVYGMPRTRSTRILWALEELGLEYVFHSVDLAKGEGQSPEFLKLNPGGKIPVLVDGDLVLSESAAICTYLGDKYSEAELVPRPGTRDRGVYDQWSYFVMTELEQPLWTIGKHKFVFPEEKRVPAIIDVALWEFQKAAAVLAKHLDGSDYLVGAAFSMVDILATHSLLWARAFKLPHHQELLDQYAERISGRTAFAKARERETQGNGSK
jgi:glutathione S-transferase